jgi:transcriptional regulator with XRE-family HTH domain
MRASARTSQAVFASYLNLTVGYVSQLERGTKRPTGAALALLNIIKRKGIEAILWSGIKALPTGLDPCFRRKSDSLERNRWRSRSSLGKFRRRVTWRYRRLNSKISSAPFADKAADWAVAITGNGRDLFAPLSVQEHERLKRRDRRVVWLSPTRKWRSSPPLKYPPSTPTLMTSWETVSREASDPQAGLDYLALYNLV